MTSANEMMKLNNASKWSGYRIIEAINQDSEEYYSKEVTLMN